MNCIYISRCNLLWINWYKWLLLSQEFYFFQSSLWYFTKLLLFLASVFVSSIMQINRQPKGKGEWKHTYLLQQLYFGWCTESCNSNSISWLIVRKRGIYLFRPCLQTTFNVLDFQHSVQQVCLSVSLQPVASHYLDDILRKTETAKYTF